ncbi:MAG: carbohydrate porin [Acidobacteria bacterium]|nr:carbohydrate porin [Acidobacteriota bacterium]
MTMTRLVVLALVLGAGLGGARAQETKAEFKPETKISGRVFADLSSRSYETGGVETDDSGFGIDVKRFYLGVGHTFDPNWSASLVLDIGDKGNKAGCKVDPIDVDGDETADAIKCTASGGDNRRYDVFVKNAYVQYKWSDAAALRLGAASNPWISYAEELYGQRYIENTLIDRDRVKFGESADWGLHFLGKALDAKVNYAFSAINGLGYSDPKRTKTMDFEGRVGVQPIKGLNFGAGFYSGKRGRDLESKPAENTATRVNALAAYVSDNFRVGVEWFAAKNWNSVDKIVTTDEEADGFSVYGRVRVAPKVELFARYDDAKPDKDRLPDLENTYVNGGVQYAFNKGLSAALVYKNEQVDTGTAATEIDNDEIGIFAVYNF